MDFGESSLSCAVNLEWLDKQGCIQRKITQKSALIRIVRNEFRDIFIEVTSEKSVPVKFQLSKFNVHNKFMSEGKASIKFQECNCTLFISNAPPSTLSTFLRTIFVKMTGDKERTPSSRQSLRSQLLSGKSKSFEEISPVTVGELNKTKVRLSKTSTTTPSPPNAKKRRLVDKNVKVPAAKKLYSQSILTSITNLNEEQKEILQACQRGQNIFFTGSAGTGKSFLVRKIISAFPPDVTCVTASTGVAACHIGGTTLHGFAGIGNGDASIEHCVKLASRPGIILNWKRCKHLIIDEISMVDGMYFEKVEAVARRIRNNDKPFGGIQLILCGDFFQLPPVIKQNENKFPNAKRRFSFQTSAWDRCIQTYFELHQVHRQSDSEFIDILNNIRIGYISPEMADKLLATSKQTIEQEGILATRLCSHTKDANLINSSKLNSLPGEIKILYAQDSDPSATKQLDQATVVPSKLELKVGAQVMLLKNISINDGLVNGARGIIVNFHESLPVVKFRNGKDYIVKHEKWVIKTAAGTTITRKQIPLSLAWAFSIHKSQGLTLDCVEMSLSRVFESGQAYVALSRAKSLKTLRILDFDVKQVWANPDVLKFYQKFRRRIQQNCIFPLGKKISHRVM